MKTPTGDGSSTLIAASSDTIDAPNGDDDSFSRGLLAAMVAFRHGEFGVRMPSEMSAIHGKIVDAFNEILTVSERRARETTRVCRAVGKGGQLKQRMSKIGRAHV